MRALAKRADSQVLVRGLRYQSGGHNDVLLGVLLDEQAGFCAYTEKRVDDLDTCAVEHFDPRLKGTPDDGYTNQYCVLQSANQRKRAKERRHRDAMFFRTRFFQEPGAFELRVQYLPAEGVYSERDIDDAEARGLIDYLGFNDSEVYDARRKHIDSLIDIFEQAGFSVEQGLAWLRDHPVCLSFPTALAARLEWELGRLLDGPSA